MILSLAITTRTNANEASTPAFTIQQSINSASFKYEIAAGQSIKDEFTIKNLDPERPISINLSFGPDVISNQESVLPQHWISFSEENIDLEPNEIKHIDFDISVPEDMETGNFRGLLQANLQSKENSQGNLGVNIAVAKSVKVEVGENKENILSKGYNFIEKNRIILIIVLITLVGTRIFLKKYYKANE